jgi:hypothetical protein
MKKLLKIFLWIVFFPFMLTYWGWKTKKKPVMVIGAVLSLLVIIGGFTGQEPIDNAAITENNPAIESEIEQQESNSASEPENSETTPETEVVDAAEAETEAEDTTENKVDNENSNPEAAESISAPIFEGYRLIEVDGGDLSGHREANVVVDIGFGDREYWAFTNEHGQLVKVIADVIVPQDESKEPVTSEGRYYPDEAKVPGTEASDLDEGHVIM